MCDFKSTLLVCVVWVEVFAFLNGTVLAAEISAPSAINTASSSLNSLPTIQGPLRVHPTNPRYFTDGTKNPDGSLKAVYLTGSHTWNNLQDMGPSNPPPVFDFTKYLDFMESHQHNFIRLWRWELPRWYEEEDQTDFFLHSSTLAANRPGHGFGWAAQV